MSAAQNKAIVLRCTEEVWNKGNMSLIPEFISPEYTFNSSMGEFKGLEGFKQYVTSMRAMFPDFHMTITSIVAEGDMVAIRFIYTGTNTGSMMGMPPTGKKVKMDEAIFMRFKKGKQVEEWVYGDSLAMMRQLGMPIPQG